MNPSPLPPPMQIMQIAAGKFLAKPLYAAALLRLADRLADGPRSADELARAVDAHGPSLQRVLRTLASVGIFAQREDGRFELTPAAEFLRDAPGSMRGMVLWLNEPRHDHVWESFEHSVRTGEPAVQKAHGRPAFDWIHSQPDLAAIFNEAMTNNAINTHAAVADAYDFSGIARLVDVGGGHGALLAAVLGRNPKLAGAVYDLPAVGDGARARLAAAGLGDRAGFVGGDFFASVPEADAHLMSFILHDWNDEQCLRILRNCHRAAPAGGRLLVVEIVIAPGNEPSIGKLIDMEMLAFTGGRERSQAEYGALFDAAGYRLERVVPTASPVSVVEGIKI